MGKWLRDEPSRLGSLSIQFSCLAPTMQLMARDIEPLEALSPWSPLWEDNDDQVKQDNI